MATKAKKIHYEVKRKLNRINTSYSSNLSVVDLDASVNEAKDLVFENYAAVVEKNTTIRNHLRELEVKNITLSPSGTSGKGNTFEFPSDFYRLMRQTAIATRTGCEARELIVRVRQTDDLSEILQDVYRDPSFDYEETVGDEVGNSLLVYKSDDFELESITIDYLKKLDDIATPSLTKTGSYTNSDGDTISTDKDLELNSTYLWRKIVDVTVLIIQRDVSDVQGFQAQLNKILALDKIYLQ